MDEQNVVFRMSAKDMNENGYDWLDVMIEADAEVEDGELASIGGEIFTKKQIEYELRALGYY